MTKMYSLPPIINHDVIIDLPICMYEMKNINGDGDLNKKCKIAPEFTGQLVSFLKTSAAAVSALEARQEKILEQLAGLKEQVLNLCDYHDIKHQSKLAVASTLRAPKIPVFVRLVVNVNPSRPCYSILALNKLWSDVDFIVSPLVHSSIKLKKIEGFKKTQSRGNATVVNLSLIWKDVTDVEVISVDAHGYVIMSESNFLRYLIRILCNECYENTMPMSKTVEIDRILDLSHQMLYQETAKDKQTILSVLSEKLGSNEWFSGKRVPEIADAAAWSAIKQCSIAKLPSNITTWYERCDNIFLN